MATNNNINNNTDLRLNTMVGINAGNTSITGAANVAVGSNALNGLTTGTNNVAIGYNGLTSLLTGSQNSGVGYNFAPALLSGSSNIFFGWGAGSSYTNAESSNILVNNAGVVGENNTLRISVTGTGSQQISRAFIGGIYNVAPSGTYQFSLIGSNDQVFGSMTAPSGGTYPSATFSGTQSETGWTVQTPTTGFSITLSGSVHWTPLNPAGTLASGTITMPTGVANLRCLVSTTQAITSLTVNPDAGHSILGAPNYLAAGSSFEMIYDAAITTWLPYASAGNSPGRLLNIQAFETAGTFTYTPTHGMGSIVYDMSGAGGGSGGAAATTGSWNATAGGGGGNRITGKLTAAQVGTTASLIIGTGGTAGAAGNNNGGNGGATIFSPASGSIVANGGMGSLGSAVYAGPGFNFLPPAAGGAVSGTTSGTIYSNQGGQSGGIALQGGSTAAGYSGFGGNSNYGAGGAPLAGGAGAGNAATGNGSGGGGCVAISSNEAGAPGASGWMFIYEYE